MNLKMSIIVQTSSQEEVSVESPVILTVLRQVRWGADLQSERLDAHGTQIEVKSNRANVEVKFRRINAQREIEQGKIQDTW